MYRAIPTAVLLVAVCLASFQEPGEARPAVAPEALAREGLDTEFHLCISVADGDTITLEGLGSVRLLGIDTPEKNDPRYPVQFMSLEASELTTELCLGNLCRLEFDPHADGLRDRYGRILAYVFTEEEVFVQEALLTRGLAQAYLRFPFDPERRERFVEWEREARRAGLGLWEDDGMAEVRYILREQQPVFEVFGMTERQWGLRYGPYVLPRIDAADLEARLSRLSIQVNENSPRDLHTLLIEQGYRLEREQDQ